MNRLLLLCFVSLLSGAPSVAIAACEDIAGEWAGLWSEQFCDGFQYSGTWTALVTNNCDFREQGDLSGVKGKINSVTKAFKATGVDPEGCGTIRVSGTITGDRMHGQYTYGEGGGGSFTGDIRIHSNFQLSVSKSGNGTVTSSLGGIKCGADCQQYYPAGARPALRALPAEGSRFSGWGGCDATSGSTCKLHLTSNRTLTAVFEQAPPNAGDTAFIGPILEMLLDESPDPLTTAIGMVIDPNGNRAAGVTVNCLRVKDITDANGAFSISNLPTIQPKIQCEATSVSASGKALRGRSRGVAPVLGGTTDVGVIVVGAVGKIVIANDEWTLSNTGFAQSPDAAMYALNVASFFTDGSPGNFLAFSTNFGLTQSELASTIRGAGHKWEVNTTVDFSLPNLLQYDAIFLAGDPVDTMVLIDYVNKGGNVYLAGGATSSSIEATRWNPFLSAFGMSFASPINGIVGSIDVSSTTHPIFSGLETLYQRNGRSITGIGIEFSFNGQGLYAVVEVAVNP